MKAFNSYDCNTETQIRELASFSLMEGIFGSIDYHKNLSIKLVFEKINKLYVGRLKGLLQEMGWPHLKPNVVIPPEFISLFLEYTSLKSPVNLKEQKRTIASFDCLASYYKKAFKFHFMDDKKTNQLSKV
jgi:hypothetical protein